VEVKLVVILVAVEMGLGAWLAVVPVRVALNPEQLVQVKDAESRPAGLVSCEKPSARTTPPSMLALVVFAAH
jgi:hypothetical protein